jgi:hypothetical protein
MKVFLSSPTWCLKNCESSCVPRSFSSPSFPWVFFSCHFSLPPLLLDAMASQSCCLPFGRVYIGVYTSALVCVHLCLYVCVRTCVYVQTVCVCVCVSVCMPKCCLFAHAQLLVSILLMMIWSLTKAQQREKLTFFIQRLWFISH